MECKKGDCKTILDSQATLKFIFRTHTSIELTQKIRASLQTSKVCPTWHL